MGVDWRWIKDNPHLAAEKIDALAKSRAEWIRLYEAEKSKNAEPPPGFAARRSNEKVT